MPELLADNIKPEDRICEISTESLELVLFLQSIQALDEEIGFSLMEIDSLPSLFSPLLISRHQQPHEEKSLKFCSAIAIVASNVFRVSQERALEAGDSLGRLRDPK